MNYWKSIQTILATVGISILLANCSSTKHGEESKKEVYAGTGIVKAINIEKGEITIDHQEIPGLMSAMTMDFEVADSSLLASLKAGDNVEFELKQKNEKVVLIKIGIVVGSGKNIDPGEIYRANCAECHGEKGEGTDKGISFLKGHALDHSEEEFIKQVRFGEEDEMPAFGDKLSDEEIRSVVKYVREEIQSEVRSVEKSSHKH